MSVKYKIFIDFDGTITCKDVGYELFRKFTDGATEPLVQRYRSGEVNSIECLTGECEIWNSKRPAVQDVEEFLDTQSLAPGFAGFLSLLEELELAPTILSEGFDFYIDRILKKNDLGHIKRITNKAAYTDVHLTPEFPFAGLGCGECSNCKGHHIRTLRPADFSAVFIGDGHSDLHASVSADILFAKSHLAEILTQKGEHFIPYGDFEDVVLRLRDIFRRQIFTASRRIAFCRISERHYEALQRLWEHGEVMRHEGHPSGLLRDADGYRRYFAQLPERADAIYLALEDQSGRFVGEAKIGFPNGSGECHHDLKLSPEFWGAGIDKESWKTVLKCSYSRWPDSVAVVTPGVENERDIDMYLDLGFEFDGVLQTRNRLESEMRATAVEFRRMVKRDVAKTWLD